jgi:hypothetical protein
MEKIRGVLSGMETILAGLTRNLDLDILDKGLGEAGGHALSFVPRSPTLGIVLPSNSPGVHALWVPTIALRTALVLKPGSAEPWTPYRLIQAFIKAGAPPEAFGFYPADHAGAGEILRRCGRGIVFGDVGATKAWLRDPRVEVHGPGYSKVVLGPDLASDWAQYLDVMVASIADNGGTVVTRTTEKGGYVFHVWDVGSRKKMLEFRPENNNHGKNVFAASPDGKTIAFVGFGANGSQIYLRSLAELEPHPLAGTGGAGSYFGAGEASFSADGEWICFDADGKLTRIPREDIEVYLSAVAGAADCFVSANHELVRVLAAQDDAFPCLTPEEFVERFRP